MIQDMENECDISGTQVRFLTAVLDCIQLNYWLRYHENPQTTKAVTKTKKISLGKKYRGGGVALSRATRKQLFEIVEIESVPT